MNVLQQVQPPVGGDQERAAEGPLHHAPATLSVSKQGVRVCSQPDGPISRAADDIDSSGRTVFPIADRRPCRGSSRPIFKEISPIIVYYPPLVAVIGYI